MPARIDSSTAEPLLKSLNAGSAQAELTFEGTWAGQSASVTTVLVQGQIPFSRDGHRQPEQALLLVVLGAAPTRDRWSLSLTTDGVDVHRLESDLADTEPHVIDLIREVEQKGLLGEGDCLSRGEHELAILSRWSNRSAAPEPAERLGVLAALARPADDA